MNLLMSGTKEFRYIPFIKTVQHAATADTDTAVKIPLLCSYLPGKWMTSGPEIAVRKPVDNICPGSREKTGRTNGVSIQRNMYSDGK